MSTYEISVSESPNQHLLKTEIDAALTPKLVVFLGFVTTTSILTVGMSASLTVGEETTLNTVVSNHDPEPLDTLKTNLLESAESYWKQKKITGYTHVAGVTFSLDANYLSDLAILQQNIASATYPHHLPTIEGTYHISNNQTELESVLGSIFGDCEALASDHTTARHNIASAATKEDAQAAHDAYVV